MAAGRQAALEIKRNKHIPGSTSPAVAARLCIWTWRAERDARDGEAFVRIRFGSCLSFFLSKDGSCKSEAFVLSVHGSVPVQVQKSRRAPSNKKVQSTLLLASKTLNAVDIARTSSGEKSWQMKKLLGNLRGDSSASTSFSRFILLGHEPTSQPSLACRGPRAQDGHLVIH